MIASNASGGPAEWGASARPPRRIVVSIRGGSGSGKSQLAKALVGQLGQDRSARIPADYYLTPASEPLDRFLAKPLDYDWDLIARVVALPDGIAVLAPDFDFVSFRRAAPSGGIPFIVRQVLFVDAMYPAPAADLTIRLFVPERVRRARVAARDAAWGTKVAGRWRQLELSNARLRQPRAECDMTVSGLSPIEDNVALIVQWLAAQYPEATIRPCPSGGAEQRGSQRGRLTRSPG